MSSANRIRLAQLRETPLSLTECEELVADARHGAVVSFGGVVRNHDGGRDVASLSYEAHPNAEAALLAVAEGIAARFPSVVVAIAHRVGALVIGDLALVCAVGSAHRAEGFAACQALIDETKAAVPIWKLQLFTDGTSEWVGADVQL